MKDSINKGARIIALSKRTDNVISGVAAEDHSFLPGANSALRISVVNTGIINNIPGLFEVVLNCNEWSICELTECN